MSYPVTYRCSTPHGEKQASSPLVGKLAKWATSEALRRSFGTKAETDLARLQLFTIAPSMHELSGDKRARKTTWREWQMNR